MRIVRVAALLFCLVAGGAPAAAQMPPVHANAVIPQPPPTAAITGWVAAEKRTTMSIDVDGATLRGWSYAGADRALPTVLFFNGNGGVIANVDSFYRSVAAQGPRVLVFDYRGYGFSTGSTDMAAFERDGVALYDAAAKDAPNGVVVYGFSMGSAVAGYVAAHRAVAGLILAAPIATAREELPIFAAGMGAPPAVAAMLVPAPDAEAAFDGVGFAAHSNAPLLVIHGTADAAVPIAQGREVLAASASVRKQIVEVPNADHNATPGATASLEAVRRFLASLRT